MSLVIDDPEAERLARMLAQRTGRTPQDAVLHALREFERELRGDVSALDPQARLERWKAFEAQHTDMGVDPGDSDLYDERGCPK